MSKGWTYGAELELSDWPRREPLPVTNMGIDVRDVTMVNSCGVAVDPKGELFHLGGEIQTAPSVGVDGPADQLGMIMRKWPETTVNYRSNLHVHVRVPGLREDVNRLKALQHYIHRWMPKVLPILEPIPEPIIKAAWPDQEVWKGARRRWARRKVSHHKLLSKDRLAMQLLATTPEEFRDLEYTDPTTRRLHPAIHPRLCVNLRQLWETDTIEFRHFPGTVEPEKLMYAVMWCRNFLECFEDNASPMPLAELWTTKRWLPIFADYDHWLERGYEATCRKYYPAQDVPQNIVAWLHNEREEIERRGAPT